MERIWAGDLAAAKQDESFTVTKRKRDLFDSSDSDDERSQLSEEEQQSISDYEVATATAATAGDTAAADIAREKAVLDEMQQVAERGRGLADARVRHLLSWIRGHMCSGVRMPGEAGPTSEAKWNDLRLLIFTEYEDTRRYLAEMLRTSIANTHLAEHRIGVYHGPTPPDKREAI